MAEFTHNLCERDWFLGPEGANPDGTFRLPSQILRNPGGWPPMGICCACGVPTVSGIYVRRDEAELLCQGEHEHPDRWSPVIGGEVSPS